MAGKELATRADLEDRYPAIFGEEASEIAELLEDNLGDDELRATDFPRYKVPSGGGRVWTDTSVGDDDDAPAKTKIRGLLLLRNTPRAHFEQTIEERAKAGIEDKTPECSSPDGKYGVGKYGTVKRDPETGETVPHSNPANPTGACKTCPMNQFGTARQGAGKGCKEREAWWIQEEGAMLPKQVQVPSASLKKSREYRVGLLAQNRNVSGVITEFGLKPVKNKAGTDYTEVSFTAVETLDRDTAQAAKAYGAKMKEMLAATAYRDATSEDDAEAPAKAAWNPADPADGGADPNDPWADDDADTTPKK